MWQIAGYVSIFAGSICLGAGLVQLIKSLKVPYGGPVGQDWGQDVYHPEVKAVEQARKNEGKRRDLVRSGWRLMGTSSALLAIGALIGFTMIAPYAIIAGIVLMLVGQMMRNKYKRLSRLFFGLGAVLGILGTLISIVFKNT